MRTRPRMPSRAAVAAAEAASGAAEPASAQPSVQINNGADSQARPANAAPISTPARKLRVRRCLLASPPRRDRVQWRPAAGGSAADRRR